MSISSNTREFIDRLRQDYPELKFRAGRQDYWSPQTRTVVFNATQELDSLKFSLLHELAHGILGHNTYHTDFELLKLESLAWDLAAKIGLKYGVAIDDDHIQNCLDTYRDWLHRRSTCPKCGTNVLQKDPSNYQCFNCHSVWTVTSERFVRPYRKISKLKTA